MLQKQVRTESFYLQTLLTISCSNLRRSCHSAGQRRPAQVAGGRAVTHGLLGAVSGCSCCFLCFSPRMETSLGERRAPPSPLLHQHLPGCPPGDWSSVWGPSPARGPTAASGRGGVPCEHPAALLCSPLPHRSGRERPGSRVTGAGAARQLRGAEPGSHTPHQRQGRTVSTRGRGQASGWAKTSPGRHTLVAPGHGHPA